MNSNEENLKQEKAPRFRKLLGIRISALIEMLIFFLLLLILAFFIHKPFNYFSVCPHPFWIIVILMATQYGTLEGLIAALLSTCILLLGPLPGRDISLDRFEYFFTLMGSPVFWFIAAVLLGELRIRQIREKEKFQQAAIESAKREQSITQSYEDLKTTKERIEVRFASQMQTALTAYSAFKELELLGKDEIIKGGQDLTRALVEPVKFSTFLLEEDTLKLVAMEGWKEDDTYSKNINNDTLLFKEIVEKQRTLSILNDKDREILRQEGVLAVPIVVKNENKVLGMIKIEEIPFFRLRLSTIESLRIIGEWVGLAYSNFLARQNAEKGQILKAQNGLFTKAFLQHEKEFLTQLGRRLKIPITLLAVSIEQKISKEDELPIAKKFQRVVKEQLRSVDQAFELEESGMNYGLLLINTSQKDAEIVRQKIANALEKELGKEININYRIASLI